MMGKLEEIYRLPFCFPCAATRARDAQKIAADAGLIARPCGSARCCHRVLRLRKLGSRSTQGDFASRIVRTMQFPARDAPAGTIPIIRAGTDRTAISPKAREATHQIPAVLIRSE